MSLAKILLPVLEHRDFDAVAHAAFTIANEQRAMVEGVYAYTAAENQVHLYYEAAAPELLDEFLKQSELRCETAVKAAQEKFDQFAATHGGIKTSFVRTDFGIAEGLAKRGRLADISVIYLSPGSDDHHWPTIRDALLFRTGRPVLLVPEGKTSPDFGKTVVIGWKDSVEAGRAVQAAKPFLAKADNIRLVSAGHDAASKGELDDLKSWLSLSFGDITADVVGTPKSDSAALLLEEASREPDTLLVMGAYSRWKWSELIFGGVTEHVLRNATVPVLMVH